MMGLWTAVDQSWPSPVRQGLINTEGPKNNSIFIFASLELQRGVLTTDWPRYTQVPWATSKILKAQTRKSQEGSNTHNRYGLLHFFVLFSNKKFLIWVFSSDLHNA